MVAESEIIQDSAVNESMYFFFHASSLAWLRPKVLAPRSGQLGPSGSHGFAPESPRCLMPRNIMDMPWTLWTFVSRVLKPEKHDRFVVDKSLRQGN